MIQKDKAETTIDVAAGGSGKSLVPLPESTDAPDGRRTKRTAVLLVFALALAGSAGWYFFKPSANVPVVQVEALVPGPVSRVLVVSGRTVAESQSEISAAVSGRVLSVNASEGERITAGNVLLMLDASRQQAALRQAIAALNNAILTMQKTQADYDRRLALGDNVSAASLEDTAQAKASAAIEVDRLEAAVEQANLGLADYSIAAPISGTVLSRLVDPGDLVDPGTVLMRVADVGHLHVQLQVDEEYAAEIRPGQTAVLKLAGRDETGTGRVTLVSDEVDAVTGGVGVKIAFDDPPAVPIGLTTVANILIERVDQALTVPRTAFVADGQNKAVFVLRDGQAVLTRVDYVDWPAARVQVSSGLSAGDRIILNVDGIEDGEAVISDDSAATEG